MNKMLDWFQCPACESSRARKFFEGPDLPVHIGVLHSTREDALRCPLGRMVLAHCEDCDLVFNPAFDPQRVEYSQRYDNSLFFSPTFQEYSRGVACRLIDTYSIRRKRVVEIGSGGGDFLRLLVELGGNLGVGIDPASRPESSQLGSLVFLNEPFAERHLTPAPDLLCSRYVLEHLPQPGQLISTIRKGLANGSKTILYFEVPNAFLVLKTLSIWDIIYEHCAYYTPLALANLFRHSGFRVLRVDEIYGEQFIGIDASAGAGASEESDSTSANTIEETLHLIANFDREHKQRLESWRDRAQDLAARGSHAVLWGAGAKGVSLLNLLPMAQTVQYVVDINPAKHGCFVPGTGQPIVAPEHVRISPPELVIVTNPLYEVEIRQELKSLGVDAEITLA